MPRLFVVVVAISGLAASARAGIQFAIDPQFGSTGHTGATARVTFEFSEHGPDDLLTVVIENNTLPKIGSKLTAVGFELPDFLIHPPTLGSSALAGYFDTLRFDDEVSPGFIDAPGGYDAMLTADGSFLGGSPNGAPSAGERASVTLNLGDTGMASEDLEVAFSQFYSSFDGRFMIARFQAVGGGGEGSDKVGGGVIPEPTTLLLLAAGCLASARRRRGWIPSPFGRKNSQDPEAHKVLP